MGRYRETLELAGTDPVAGRDRRLQVVVAPTGSDRLAQTRTDA